MMNVSGKVKLVMSIFLVTLVSSVTFAIEQSYTFDISACFKSSSGPNMLYVCTNDEQGRMSFHISSCTKKSSGVQTLLSCTLSDNNNLSQNSKKQTVGRGQYVQTHSKTLNIVTRRYAEVNALYQALITVTQVCQGENYNLLDVRYSNDAVSALPYLEAIATVDYICK